MSPMETYHGHVRTPLDAIILFEACRLGLLPRVQRRLSEKERQAITSGSVFVWDEREASMRRWTDGKSWSASRVSGSFLTYREMEGKRGGGGFGSSHTHSPESGDNGSDSDDKPDDGPDGYRYKPDGLMKQSFSIQTSTHLKLHLISYFCRSHVAANDLKQPSHDPGLKHIRIPKGMYPDATDQATIPPVTSQPILSAYPALSPLPPQVVYAGPAPQMAHATPVHYFTPVYAQPMMLEAQSQVHAHAQAQTHGHGHMHAHVHSHPPHKAAPAGYLAPAPAPGYGWPTPPNKASNAPLQAIMNSPKSSYPDVKPPAPHVYDDRRRDHRDRPDAKRHASGRVSPDWNPSHRVAERDSAAALAVQDAPYQPSAVWREDARAIKALNRSFII
ncbi:Gti1/Pac2 family-domain-containing protein [Dipodascopsis tothii]|uniref:Gti1/Pac2 family-domain-containing protein n=1 Tax=Dipodascopsis tothii TaxID=44089 RepID=UPI0034CEF79E